MKNLGLSDRDVASLCRGPREAPADDVEALKKFARKVARIGLIDVEIACSCADEVYPSGNYEMKRKLKSLIKEAKYLAGVTKGVKKE